jgi:hypothetical protein
MTLLLSLILSKSSWSSSTFTSDKEAYSDAVKTKISSALFDKDVALDTQVVPAALLEDERTSDSADDPSENTEEDSSDDAELFAPHPAFLFHSSETLSLTARDRPTVLQSIDRPPH